MSHDFEELLASLNARKVRYLIGGAHALALHARPRATFPASPSHVANEEAGGPHQTVNDSGWNAADGHWKARRPGAKVLKSLVTDMADAARKDLKATA